MKFCGSYSFLMILNESIKLVPQNGKLMAFITIFSLALSSALFLLLNYSLQSLLMDITANLQKSFMPDLSSFNFLDPTFNMSDPNSSNYMLDPSSFNMSGSNYSFNMPSSFNMPDPNFSFNMSSSFNMPDDPNPFGSANSSSFITPQSGFNFYEITALARQDFSILLAVQIPILFNFFIITFFTSISTILVSAMSYSAKNLSLKGLLSLIWRTWTRPLITTLYVSALVMGYSVVVVMLVAPPLMYPNTATFSAAIVLATITLILYLYLFVDWALAIVVSVVEESCYGLEALGKGAALVRGRKLHGFLLNICLNVVVLIIFQGCKMIIGNKSSVNPMFIGLFVVNVSCLAKIFLVVGYTVLYFQCKMQHGEEIELHGTVQYSKLPPTQLAI